MANQDRPCGFKPVGKCLRVNPYKAESAIYVGDMLKQNANGTVEPVASSGSEHAGACIGVAMTNAAAGAEVLVADHPDQQFYGQSSTADIDAQTDFGLNYSIVGANPDTSFKCSRMEIKGDSGASTATLSVKILRLYRDVQEDGLGANAKVVFIINNHQLNSGTGTTGV